MPQQQKQVNNAMDFLRYFRPNGVINLVALHPTKKTVKPRGITRSIYNGDARNDISKFIEQYNGKRNLYFTVNEPYPNSPDTKLNKSHIAGITHVFADIDPDKTKPFKDERERLIQLADNLSSDLLIPPTFIIDSGGGMQPFWQLDKLYSASKKRTVAIEDLGRGLAKKLHGDNVQNIDRIMRLPFTANIPDDKKIAAGRSVAQSGLLFYAVDKDRYTYKDLCRFAPPVKQSKTETDMSGEPLDMDLAFRQQYTAENAIAELKDDRLNRIWTGEVPANANSRSEHDMALVARLKHHEWSLQQVAAALYSFPHGKRNDNTEREIRRAYARVTGVVAGQSFNALPQADIDRIQAQDADPNHKAARAKADDPPPATLLHMVTYDDAEPINTIPLIYNVLEAHSIAVMYGDSNIGKSFLALDMAGHVAAGLPWNGRYTQSGSVLYLASEAGKGIYKRIKALREHRLNTPADLMFVPQQLNLHDPQAHLQSTIESVKWMEKQTGKPCRLIIVDTLAQTMGGGNENSPEDMGQYIANASRLVESTGATVMLVHHTGKDDSKGARGHSSLRAAADSELKVTFSDVGQRVIEFRKQRDDEMEGPLPFALIPLKVGTATRPTMADTNSFEEFDITTCIIRTPGDAGFEFEAVTTTFDPNEKAILAALSIISPKRPLPIQELGTYYGFIVTHNHTDDVLNNTFNSVTNPLPGIGPLSDLGATRKRAFQRARDKLVTKGVINKDHKDQWFIVNGDNGDKMVT